jgi:hypothetical protein
MELFLRVRCFRSLQRKQKIEFFDSRQKSRRCLPGGCDPCIELEALVCSNTSNDIYMTNGEVP